MDHDVLASDFVDYAIRLEENFAIVCNTDALELFWDMTSKRKLGECEAKRFELVDNI